MPLTETDFPDVDPSVAPVAPTSGGADEADFPDIPDIPISPEVQANRDASAAARQKQMGQVAFDSAHPMSARQDALVHGQPISEAYTPPTFMQKVGQYANSIGSNWSIGEQKVQRALHIAPEHAQGVIDRLTESDDINNDAARQSIAKFNSDTEGAGAPSPEIAQGLPSLGLAMIPGVGPELYAAVTASSSYQDSIRAGADPKDAFAHAAAAGVGSELGFRGVPMVRPELAKLGGVTGRAAEGGAMGEAMDLTTPNDGDPRTMGAATKMGTLALMGGRLFPPGQAPRPRPTAPKPIEPAPLPEIDPNGITQEIDPQSVRGDHVDPMRPSPTDLHQIVHEGLDPNAITQEMPAVRESDPNAVTGEQRIVPMRKEAPGTIGPNGMGHRMLTDYSGRVRDEDVSTPTTGVETINDVSEPNSAERVAAEMDSAAADEAARDKRIAGSLEAATVNRSELNRQPARIGTNAARDTAELAPKVSPKPEESNTARTDEQVDPAPETKVDEVTPVQEELHGGIPKAPEGIEPQLRAAKAEQEIRAEKAKIEEADHEAINHEPTQEPVPAPKPPKGIKEEEAGHETGTEFNAVDPHLADTVGDTYKSSTKEIGKAVPKKPVEKAGRTDGPTTSKGGEGKQNENAPATETAKAAPKAVGDTEVKKPTEHKDFAGIPHEHLDAIVKPVARLAKVGLDLWSKPLVDVVHGQAGEVGKKIGARARNTIDHAKKMMGQLSETRESTMKAANARANKSLSEVDWKGKNWGTARSVDVVEGRVEPHAHERQFMNGYRKLVKDTGKMAEDAGVQISLANGESVKFKASTDGKRFARSLTPEGHDVIAQTGSEGHATLKAALKDMNPGLSDADLEKSMAVLRDRGLTKKASVEEARTIKNFPTHLKVDGKVVQILKADPYSAVESLTHQFPQRIAFAKEFGQGNLEESVKEFVSAGGNQKDAENLIRALNVMPIDAPGSVFKPGSAEAEIVKSVNGALSAVKAIQLSSSFIPNLYETISKVPALGGGVRWMKALAQSGMHPVESAREIARLGGTVEGVMRWLKEPNENISQYMGRIAGQTILFPAKLANKANAVVSGITGTMMVRDLRAGKGTEFDKIRLQIMGFDPKQVEHLMGGKATTDEYQAVVTRMVETTQGENQVAAQMSRAGNSRYYKHAVAFDRFARMTADRTLKVADQVMQAKTPKERAAALAVATQYFGGSTVSGALTYATRALLVGGGAILYAQATDGWDGAADFAGNSLLYTLLGGPTDAIRQVMGGGKSPTEAAGALIYPVSVMQQVYNFVTDSGVYKDKRGVEKAVTLLQSNTALYPTIATMAGAEGMADPRLNAATKAYWKWRKAEGIPAPHGEESGYNEFRDNMRHATLAIKDGNDPTERLNKAMANKGDDPHAISRSLFSRRLLDKLSEEQKGKLKSHIGDEGYENLVHHDELLSQWGEVYKRMRAPRKERPTSRPARPTRPSAPQHEMAGSVVPVDASESADN